MSEQANARIASGSCTLLKKPESGANFFINYNRASICEAREMTAQAPIVSSKEVKRLSQLAPARTIFAIALDWLMIVAAIAISEYIDSWLFYFPTVAIISGRMHALGVLTHDAAHYRFFKNRQRNEWIGDLFVAWPIFISVDGYRQNHLAHHQNVNTEDDPDWVTKIGSDAFTFPQKAWTMVKHMSGYLIAIQTLCDMRRLLPLIRKNDRSTRQYKLIRAGYYVIWGLAFTFLGVWSQVFLYWIVPFFTLLFLFQHVRSVAEHFGADMDYSKELDGTRTVLPHAWERLFFAPHNVNFHLEHHLYPSVPFYNLPKLHKALMGDAHYRSNAHITRGYSTGLVRECLA